MDRTLKFIILIFGVLAFVVAFGFLIVLLFPFIMGGFFLIAFVSLLIGIFMLLLKCGIALWMFTEPEKSYVEKANNNFSLKQSKEVGREAN